MKSLFWLVVYLCFVELVLSACSGMPKSFNGIPCASTTRYWDGQMGACGCGTSGSNPFSWQWNNYTEAGSLPIFGSGTWCGSGCGKCYQLTPTGYSPTGGTGCGNCNPITVMITNLCPQQGNEQWCTYPVNQYGYGAHFDLMDYQMNGLISKLGWNNPEVTYKEVPCGGEGSPSSSEFNQCQCK
eukprot:Phypoly_transcript_22333.p1 GENE.Phypoly_transcript_22333~~Phypoly_transcript_22333.p1  ORF type:complete len:184 (+),score=11.01 Phypoly_transcript_22333:28-579(+)